MKFSHVSALIACVAVVAFATGVAFTEDKPKPKPLSPAEMEQKVMGLGAKCPEHDALKHYVGEWDVAGKAVSQVMGEFPFTGKASMQPMWDGRFLKMSYEGPGPMGTMYGAGYAGFNRLSGKYESTWMMSMNTNIEKVTGTFDAEKKTFTYTGKMHMPDGTTWAVRQLNVVESKDKIVERHYTTPQGGKEYMTVEMVYTRSAAKAAKPTTGK